MYAHTGFAEMDMDASPTRHDVARRVRRRVDPEQVPDFAQDPIYGLSDGEGSDDRGLAPPGLFRVPHWEESDDASDEGASISPSSSRAESWLTEEQLRLLHEDRDPSGWALDDGGFGEAEYQAQADGSSLGDGEGWFDGVGNRRGSPFRVAHFRPITPEVQEVTSDGTQVDQDQDILVLGADGLWQNPPSPHHVPSSSVDGAGLFRPVV